ncbi:uncharacterized protein LOC117242951 [Bombus vosnesenskii]|uniref:Uncharacterized protein LOC117242951 n=1 Tax=Bombus vosnesenskii TaxID=207650 RepID=A0A6J3LL39_9HYME|nr:uncharacterized protein LOC117242951 [Bombus vosnesenskii]
MLFEGESNVFLTEAFYLTIVRIRNTLQNDHGMCRMKRGRRRGLSGKCLLRGSLKVKGNTSTSGTSGLSWPINARRKHTQNLLSIPIDTKSETNAKPRPELAAGFSCIKRIHNGFWLQNQRQDIRRDSQSSFVASQFPLMLSGLAIDAVHPIRHRRVPPRLGPFVTSVRWNWIMDDHRLRG